MSKIWLIILVASISTLLFTDANGAITAMISGSHQAVDLAINLVALYGFWLGFFAILEKLNLSDKLARLLRPITKFLFKSADEQTEKYIIMNMSANLLGLGNAATPMGINALKRLSVGKTRATADMIMMIVISSTSLQLLPTTVIGMRATHGSANPSGFLPASIVATVVSTILGIFLVKLCKKLFPDKDEKQLALDAAKKLEKRTLKAKKPAPALGSALNTKDNKTDKIKSAASINEISAAKQIKSAANITPSNIVSVSAYSRRSSSLLTDSRRSSSLLTENDNIQTDSARGESAQASYSVRARVADKTTAENKTDANALQRGAPKRSEK